MCEKIHFQAVAFIFENKIDFSFHLYQAFNDLEELLEETDICIAIKERLTKDSGIAANSSYDNIVRKLATKPNSKGKANSFSSIMFAM